MTQVSSHNQLNEASEDGDPQIFGLMAEFEDVSSVLAAARAVRDAGYRRFDVHSPFPIHGVEKAVGIPPTILPWLVLGGGLTGMTAGLVLTIYTMSIDYPYLISGKPFNSMPAWIPVIFELTILLSAFAAVFGMLLLNKLPLLSHPLLNNERFRRATSDRFFVVIDARDQMFDADRTSELLNDQGAAAVELVMD